jgi:hypothetical protein
MYDRLSQHLDVTKTVTPEKFAFRKTAIYILTNNNLPALNGSSQIVGIVCDLAKVFDCENHILLDNLLCYGTAIL